MFFFLNVWCAQIIIIYNKNATFCKKKIKINKNCHIWFHGNFKMYSHYNSEWRTNFKKWYAFDMHTTTARAVKTVLLWYSESKKSSSLRGVLDAQHRKLALFFIHCSLCVFFLCRQCVYFTSGCGERKLNLAARRRCFEEV